MTKLTQILLASACLITAGAAYAAPPRVMVMPERSWASANGYGKDVNMNGRTRFIVDYEKCFMDQKFNQVASAINALMQNYDFPLVNAMQQTSADQADEAFDAIYTSQETGGAIQRDALDDLLAQTKPDILINVGWEKNSLGFNYSISYHMDAVDAYSNKSIATITGASEVVPSSQSESDLLAHLANNHMAEFASKLMSYFEDVQQNGREIVLTLSIAEGCDINFDSVMDDNDLTTILFNWMEENTVNHQFSEATTSPNRVVYDQVRMPAKNERGRTIQARQYVDGLKKYLMENYSLNSENRSTGLGKGRLIIVE